MIFDGVWLFEGVQDWFEDLGNDVLAVAGNVWTQAYSYSPTWLRNIWNTLGDISLFIGYGALDFIRDPTGAIANIIASVYNYSPQWLRSIWDTLTTLHYKASLAFWDFVGDPVGALTGLVTNVYSYSPTWLKSVFSKLIDFAAYMSMGFLTFMEDPVGAIGGALAPVTGKLDDLKTWAGNFKFPEVVIPSITWPNWHDLIVTPIANAFNTAIEGFTFDLFAPLKDFTGWMWEGLSVGAVKVGTFLNENVVYPLINGLRWLWDRMVLGLSSIATSLIDHVRHWGTITPETAMEHLPSLIALTAGAGLGVVALDAVTSIKILGSGLELGPVGDFLNRFINPGMVTGLAIGAVLTSALGTPLTQWALNQFRPTMFDADTLNRALWRGLITETEWAAGYGYLGFNPERIDVQKELRVRLPGIGDVIRFAVREAFYPDYVARYGLDKEYPPELTAYGVKLGYLEETLKYNWFSHWELPSLGMGYEMLHRGIITPPDLDSLFMAHDIIPWWRERLLGLSFRVYTRVDVRRMYRENVLDRAGVKRAYLDLGYDPEKAENMTRFTIAYYEHGDRAYTTTEILKGYRTGQLSADSAIELLMDLDYTEDHAAYALSLEDHRGKEEGRELSRSQLEKAFIEGLIPGSTLMDRLEAAGWTKEATDIIYRMALIRKQEDEAVGQVGAERDVARATLNSAFRLEIIAETEYRERMRALRYTEDAITLFLEVDKAQMIDEPKRLPLGTLREALRKEKITVAEFRRRAGIIGYPTEDVDIVVSMEAA